MQKLKVRQIGNSLGVVLPKDALDQLGIGKDDELGFVLNDEGFRLIAYDEELADAQAWIEKGAKRYRNTLRALAQ